MRPWHPLWRLALQQPDLVVEHAAAYAALAADDGAAALSTLGRRLAWQFAGGLCLAVAATLAGVSVLLWAALPVWSAGWPWAAVIVPLLPLVGGVLALNRPNHGSPAFARLRAQTGLDRATLREFRVDGERS